MTHTTVVLLQYSSQWWDIIGRHSTQTGFHRPSPEPVVMVAIWRINREVEHGQSTVSGEAAPMLHVFSS
jgi:hypothetical protein